MIAQATDGIDKIDPADHLGLVGMILSRDFSGLRGDDRDEAEAEGRLALVKAAETYDPSEGTTFATWGCSCVRYAVLAWLRTRRRQGRVASASQLAPPGGEDFVFDPADRAAPDPADLAERREVEAAPSRVIARTRKGGKRAISADLPEVAQVAARAAELRDTMFGAVSTDDIREVMAGVVKRAKAGTHQDVKLLLSMIGGTGGVGGVTVQQAVIVQGGDRADAD